MSDVARYEVFSSQGVKQHPGGESSFGTNWFWHLKAANNEIVAQSEGYTREDDAWEGARAAHRAALEAAADPLIVARST